MLRMLSVRQPWAWALIHAGKTVENRSRNIAGDYRGPVLIQASKRAVDGDDPIWDAEAFRRALAESDGSRELMDVRGAILGVVDLVDVHGPHDGVRAVGRGQNASGTKFWGTWADCGPWAEAGAWHLIFENPRALDTPLPIRGGLGLRKVPQLEIVGDWLAEIVDGCTCHNPTSGPHEPGCGLEPLAKLTAVTA